MKRIKTRYRVSAVVVVMLVSIMAIQGQNKPVDAVEVRKSTDTPVQAKRQANGVIKAYIKQVFGACKKEASAYLMKTNPTYNTSLINHNYIGDTFVYDSSYIGLFQVNDSVKQAEGYTTDDLLNYKTNTDIAYAMFVANGYNFPSDSCVNY